MKRAYAPPLFLGLRFPPVEVDVIEWDNEARVATIVMPLAPNTIINLLRKRDGKPPLAAVEKQVPITYLHKL